VEPKYSLLGRLFSLGYACRVRREALDHALSRVDVPVKVVDVGSGPGDSVKLLTSRSSVSYVIAVEPSPLLVQKSCSTAMHLCDAVQAVAEHLPLRDKGVGLVSSFYAVRDYRDTLKGLSELLRVAAEAVAIGDIFLPEDILRRLLVKTWACIIAPLLAAMVYLVRGARYRGICRSLRGWCSVEKLASTIAEIGRGAFRVAYRSLILGGMGYVVAWREDNSGADWGQRDTLRSTPCPGASGERPPRGTASDEDR